MQGKDTSSTTGTEKQGDDAAGLAASGASGNGGVPGSSAVSAALNQGSASQSAQGAGQSSTTVHKDEKTQQQILENRKIGSFPSDLSNSKPIFSVKSKNQQAKDRFGQRAQEYLDSHKMSIYLQDAIKIILDRREEKPLDLLTDYFNTTLRGEHIVLREYAFVSATQLNRKCFLQQIRKVFHSTPYYHVLTGLDYHQMICLICSDFPRNLMIETIKTLPLAKKDGAISIKTGTDILCEQFQLEKLQAAVCIYFFYNEFMEQVRQSFQEAQSAPQLNPNDQVSLMLIFTSINNLVQRLKSSSFPLPAIEAIVEVLLIKTEAYQEVKDQPLVLIQDVIDHFSGATISYVEFSQGMIRNKTLLSEIYEPIYNKRVFQVQDMLKEIAAEQAANVVKDQMKKQKSKKQTKTTGK